MATTNPSLFGMLGDEQYMQRQLDEQRAKAFAEQTQEQRLAGMGYKAGAQLGRGLAGAFGVDVTDPTIRKASQLRALASQFDTTTPEGIRKYAMAIKDIDPNVALQASQMATEMEDKLSTIANRSMTDPQRNANRLTQLESSIAAVEKMDQNDPNVKNVLGKLKSEQATLKDIVLTRKSQIVGTATDTKLAGQGVYEDDKGQFIYGTDKQGNQVRLPYSGGIDRTTAKVTATASNKGPVAGAEEIAKLDAKRLNEANSASDKAIEQAGLLRQLLKTPQPISGTGANMRASVLRVFSTMGLAGAKDTEALANADQFNALAGERVLGFIKTLGTNPTDTDREFARTIGPALEKGEKTNTDLINYLLNRAKEVTQSAKAMEKHFYDNNYSLKGYESPFISTVEAPTFSKMSVDDLAKAANGKIVNGVFVPNK